MIKETVDSYGNLTPRRKALTMVGVILAMLLSALDQTIVGTALPRIVTDLGGAEHLTWVVTAYMLASTVSVPIYGKLSDLYGRKWFFFGGIVIFLIGSMLCGLSQDMLQLVIFRAIQGIGAGAIMGNAFAIIGDLFEPKERAKWQGVMGGVFGLASVIGPALGGWLTDNASWQWVFYVNIPIGILALLVIGFLMPKITPAIKNKVLDYWGAVFLTTSLVPLLLALSWGGSQYAWDSPMIVGLLIGGMVSLGAFIFAESRAKEPIIPLSLFKNSIFTTSAIVTFLTGAAMFGAIVYIPLFAQLVQGVSATKSGTIMTPLMIGLISASAISGQIIARTGRYKPNAVFGASLMVLSLLWLSFITAGTSSGKLMVQMICLGVSLGFLMPVFNIAVQNAFDRSKLGVVTATIQMFRSVGGTVGIALLGVVFSYGLATQAHKLVNTAYAQTTASQVDATDPNVLQSTLFPETQAAIRQKFESLPADQQAQMNSDFDTFVAKARQSFTVSVSHVFRLSTALALIGFIATLFLKELPLRSKDDKPNTATEAGEELAAGLGQAEDKDEPVLR